MRLAYWTKNRYLKKLASKGIIGSEAIERWDAYRQKYDRFLELDTLITERILDFLEEEFEFTEEDGDVHVEIGRMGSRIILNKDSWSGPETVITPINLTISKHPEYSFEEEDIVSYSHKIDNFTYDYDFESFFGALGVLLSEDYAYGGDPWHEASSPSTELERITLNPTHPRRKNPASAATLLALGLGYWIGKK